MIMLRNSCLHDAIAIELLFFNTPFDDVQSVRKTGRSWHMSTKTWRSCTEIMALVAEHAMHLIAPMKALLTDCFKHEQFYLPSAQRVVHAINQVMEYQYV